VAPGDSLAIELVWSALWPSFLLRSLCRKSKATCRPRRISSNPASRKLAGIISALGFLCGGNRACRILPRTSVLGGHEGRSCRPSGRD